MTQIMISRVAVAALAASVLFAAPAAADRARAARPDVETHPQNDARLAASGAYAGHESHRPRGYDDRYGYNRWGQSSFDVRELSRDAVRICRQAVRRDAYRTGFDEVEFEDGRRVEQIGPRGFFVEFREVEFEGRRRDIETRVSCEVRRGTVVNLSGIPHPRGRAGYDPRW